TVNPRLSPFCMFPPPSSLVQMPDQCNNNPVQRPSRGSRMRRCGAASVRIEEKETTMNIFSRSAFTANALLVTVLASSPQGVWAQTPQQMEYERQQREYRQQQERQQQEQQRQQQLMNENARRQQEESRRLNAPTSPSSTPGYQGQRPTPGYQGAAPQGTPGRSRTQETPPVVTTAADWVSTCSSPAYGGTDVYVARSTISRSGNLVKMWDMYDFKTTQTADGKHYLSAKNQHEYDCKGKRRRMLSTT